MKSSNLNTERKGSLNIAELNAYNSAYGERLAVKDYLTFMLLPAFFLLVILFLFSFRWWLAILGAFAGAYYGYKYIMPRVIRQKYMLSALHERNKFVNNMTQILTDEHRTITKSLRMARDRTYGELNYDLNVLEASIISSNDKEIREAFAAFNEKYKEDVIFSQYFEQLETSVKEGRADVSVYQDIKSYHNDVVEKQEEYLRIKKGHFKDLITMMRTVFIFLFAVAFSSGFEVYWLAFARNPVANGFNTVYLILLLKVLMKFIENYFDDEIMTLEVK